MIEYRWLTNDEIADMVNEVCDTHGWMRLNINEDHPTCRVLGAFDGIALVAFIALQLIPLIGPEWADSDHRDGKISRQLADRMHEFLQEVNARGAITMCENEVSRRLAERHGMQPVTMPVYQWIGV